MKETTKSIFYPIVIPFIIGAMFFGGWFLFIEPEVDEPVGVELGGRSGPDRDVFGTRTNTTTVPITFFSDVDGSAIATATAVILRPLIHTDAFSLTLSTPNASATSEVYYKIWGSNVDSCDATATSTTDDSYVSGDPYVSDIPWFDMVDSDSSGQFQDQDTFGKNSATGTTRLITDVNWSCLRFEASGASSTLWMQIKEKINTIN